MKYRVNKTKRMNRNLIFLLRILIYTKYMIFFGFQGYLGHYKLVVVNASGFLLLLFFLFVGSTTINLD